MGIPSFYRWIVERYPDVVADAIEEAPVVVNGVSVPVDLTGKNPNGIEYDNLYLDMNGIIHPCFHPEGMPAPVTYGEVFQSVYKYLDKIFSVIRPRKLLYMAIDGVAPRAKMNQQRARRFRAAKDAADEASGMEKQSEGEDMALSKKIEKLDSNVITPGTAFMTLLSEALRFYVHLRMNNEPGWRRIKVIISDASVPGEGEHKIMSYIRLQRNLPGFKPNTTHCLYGLDADLIMLALATHEIHFSVLREEVRKVYGNDNSSRDRNGSSSLVNSPEDKENQGKVYVKNMEAYITRQKFQFLHIWTLRDYLRHDLRIPTVKMDLERLIDDFVFMCIFVGNDFLPHVPSLEISEGAIDLLMAVYKKQFVQMGGYLTNSYEINLKSVEQFVQAVSSNEDEIFRKRTQVQREREIRFRRFSNNCSSKKTKSSTDQIIHNANPPIDQVKLGEEGWKERFYAQKFEAKTDDDREEIRRQAVQKYVEGICWVMQYYYQGVCSWQWFYPYHYAPFASDFCGIDKLEIQFTLGEPFKPFDQLMGVLPAASAHALPFFYRKLMSDSSSPIIDFYPTDFELDMNGKRHSWQAICKLPFIEESRLLAELAKVEETLTEDEKQRNSLGKDILFMHKNNPLAGDILHFCKLERLRWPLDNVKREIQPNYSGGMNGYVYISTESMCPAEINPPFEDMATIVNNKVLSFVYEHPPFHPHIPRPPAGVNMRQSFVKAKDILPPPVLWHETSASRARILSERIILESISGPRLAKLSRELVRKYIHMKSSESQACIVAHSKVGLEPIGEKELNGVEENYITAVDGKEPDGASDSNHIVVPPKKRKRKRGKNKSQDQVATVVGMDAGTGNEIAATEGKVQDGDSEVHTILVDRNPGVSGKESGGSENHIAAEPKKRKRKWKKRNKIENPVTKCDGIEAEGGSDIIVARIGEEQDGVNGDHSALVGQVQVLVGKEPGGGSENHIAAPPRKRKPRKRGKKSETSTTKCDEMKVDGGDDINVARIGEKEQDGVNGDHSASVGQVQVLVGKEPGGGREYPIAAEPKKSENFTTKCDEIKADGGNDIHVARIGEKEQDGDNGDQSASVCQIDVLVRKAAKSRKRRLRQKLKKSSGNGVATDVGKEADRGSDSHIVSVGGQVADQGSEMNMAANGSKEPDSENQVAAAVGLKELEGGHENATEPQNKQVGQRCKKKRRIGEDLNNGA